MNNTKELFLLFVLFYLFLIGVLIREMIHTTPKPDQDTRNYCWQFAVNREHDFAGTKYEQTADQFYKNCVSDVTGIPQEGSK